jgi:uncharacterized membrane protein YesL
MQRLWDVVKLNFMWLIFSLPLVTLGCSTIAAFTVSLKMSEEREGRIAHDFVKAFAANWKQGIPMSFITVICYFAVYYDFQIYNATEENALPFLLIGVFSAYIFTLCLIYAYPLLARYENTILNTLKNSFRLGMKYFGRTLMLVFIVAVEVVIIMWNTTTQFVGLLMGPACIIFTISGVAMHIFRDMETDPSTTSNNPADFDDYDRSDRDTSDADSEKNNS